MERIPSGSRDDLLSQFAHDLRTPLTAIRSFSEILVDNPDLPDSERNRFLSVVLEESERLHRHIERVLDFSGQGTAETKERGQVSMTNNGTKYPGHQHQRQLCRAD